MSCGVGGEGGGRTGRVFCAEGASLPEVLEHGHVQALQAARQRQPQHRKAIAQRSNPARSLECMRSGGARLAALDEVLDHDCLEVHIDSEWHHHHLPRAVPRSTVI